MSFAIKKNNEVTYIAQNSATTTPNSDNWSENGTSIFNNNTGNVGINNRNPNFNLDVSGTTNITGNLTAFNLDVSGSTNVSGNLIVDTNALFVDASNNRVGINTSNPAFNLDVSGNTIVRGNLHQSVLYLTGGSNNLTTLSPNSILVFAGNTESFVVLPTITSSNDGLTFKISGFFSSGTAASNSYIQRSGSSLIYFQKSTTGVTQFSFTDLSPATLVAYNSNWYVV